MRLINSFTYANVIDIEQRAESNFGVSNTVPDMSLSLRDLLDRHNSGGKVKTFEPVYADSDSRIPVGLENMDKFERWELSKQLSDFISVERGRIVSARQAREAEAYKARVDEAVRSRLASIADKEPDPA